MNDYMATNGDIIIHNISPLDQRIYRVIGTFLGGEGQDGFVELSSLTHPKPRPLDIIIPIWMFEQMVCDGIIECVWREESE